MRDTNKLKKKIFFFHFLDKTIRLSTGQKHSPTLFPTPVGKSYVCEEEVSIPLSDGKNNAVLLLRFVFINILRLISIFYIII